MDSEIENTVETGFSHTWLFLQSVYSYYIHLKRNCKKQPVSTVYSYIVFIAKIVFVYGVSTRVLKTMNIFKYAKKQTFCTITSLLNKYK